MWLKNYFIRFRHISENINNIAIHLIGTLLNSMELTVTKNTVFTELLLYRVIRGQ